jgi:hypothetical protein
MSGPPAARFRALTRAVSVEAIPAIPKVTYDEVATMDGVVVTPGTRWA